MIDNTIISGTVRRERRIRVRIQITLPRAHKKFEEAALKHITALHPLLGYSTPEQITISQTNRRDSRAEVEVVFTYQPFPDEKSEYAWFRTAVTKYLRCLTTLTVRQLLR